MESILSISHLTKKYGAFLAVNDLSLDIKQNTCVGFLGPNGAGKTTTIKILTGIIKQTSGNAKIMGHDINTDFKKAMSHVGAMVETPEFFSGFTPVDALSYNGKIRGIKGSMLEDRISKVLQQTGMSEWAKKRIGTFSKGMKQRVAIASCLLHDPDLLILDEPTSGLDPKGIRDVREIVESLKNQGKTIFMSSHLLSEVKTICDEIALIYDGKIVDYKPIADLQNSTNVSKIKIEFLTPPAQSQITMIEEYEGVQKVSCENSKAIVLFEGNSDQKSDFLSYLQSEGMRVVSFSSSDTILEDLYDRIIPDSVK